MSMTLRKRDRLPSRMADWLNPISSIWDRDFFDTNLDFFTRRVVSVPSVNITETPNDYVLEVAAPGLKREDFKLAVEDHALSISAENTDEKKEEKDGYCRQEYTFNSFQRSFALPDQVKEGEISATYTDGILKITVPKTTESVAQPAHTIPVS
ncbi:Hsp20/alpha crystallin family protein [Parapedobacter koreensis]|uniref:Heat shock protein Hsp20 n=1 Tax=Parapedobacter koreensis TaxID=332977 RepID=A0A1H7MYT0_9SPHI|nr:Hsp20/alpha crystallin family protein [Parapedobacter koreensis]SEL16373.1 heat shock protein Hsp20 [Parapedobacter koreensis]